MKHAITKIFECKAEPVDRQAWKGVKKTRNSFSPADRDKEREQARLLKQWRKDQREFCSELYRTIHFFKTSTPEHCLHFAIRNPCDAAIVVAPACPTFSEMELIKLSDAVRAAFSTCGPTDRFPLAFINATTGDEIIPPRSMSFDTAIHALPIFTNDCYESVLKRFVSEWEDFEIADNKANASNRSVSMNHP